MNISLRTTCETKTGLFLIVVFSNLFNPQNYGHQISTFGGNFTLFFLLTCLTKRVVFYSEHTSYVLPPKQNP